jgi:hypothetical protein
MLPLFSCSQCFLWSYHIDEVLLDFLVFAAALIVSSENWWRQVCPGVSCDEKETAGYRSSQPGRAKGLGGDSRRAPVGKKVDDHDQQNGSDDGNDEFTR